MKDYGLSQIVSPRSRIYHQIYQYYYFCEYVRAMSAATLSSKTYTINDFLRHSQLRDLRRITNQMIYDWISCQQTRGNSGRSINDRLAHLKAMLRWQQEMNLRMLKLRLPLITKINEQPPRKVVFSREDISRVLAKANEIQWLLIHLAFDCGLRLSEIRNLRLGDLHHDRLSIIGKGNKKRYVYLCPEVQKRLRLWILRQKIHAYLWPSSINLGQPLSTYTLRSYMQAAFAQAGFTNFCPHDLRHSYATDLKLLGVPTRQIQAGLGHSTEAVTERYLSDLDGYDLIEMYRIKYTAGKSL